MSETKSRYESDYDRGVKAFREVLGSYDRINLLYFNETGGVETSPASIRKWFRDRNTPLPVICVLLELLWKERPETDIDVFTFFPYLRNYGVVSEEGDPLA